MWEHILDIGGFTLTSFDIGFGFNAQYSCLYNEAAV